MEKSNRIEKIINDQTNIRNVALLGKHQAPSDFKIKGHVDHGRSTLHDYLVSAAGLTDVGNTKLKIAKSSALFYNETHLINLGLLDYSGYSKPAAQFLHDGAVLVVCLKINSDSLI